MESDRYQVLRQVVRIANCSESDYPRSIKGILRFLVKSLLLEEASLKLLDSSQKYLSRVIKASGSDLFLPIEQKPGKTPEGDALHQRRTVVEGNTVFIPVGNNGCEYGVLALCTAPFNALSPQNIDLCQDVCAQLAGLARYALVSAEQQRKVRQLGLLSELGRELNQARSLPDLLRNAGHTLLRKSGASCVILRPLYGGTVLGRDHVLTLPAYRGMRTVFVDLEEEQSTRVASEGSPVFRDGLAGKGTFPGPIPPAMVTIPLIFQEQIQGTLTLFGGTEEDHILFNRDAEARRFFTDIGSQIAHALDRVTARERLGALSAENDRKLRELSLLYRISRGMHTTLRLNDLMHLILSAVTVPGGGGFGLAVLFMINERSGTLQGMLGVTPETAVEVLPLEEDPLAWEHPVINDKSKEAQHAALFCRRVMKQRLPLDPTANALARAANEGRVIFVPHPAAEPPAGAALAEALNLSPYACAPLLGRERPLAVLLVANPESREEIAADRLRFLDLFASQAGAAMENSLLIHRLETAQMDLRETQERLIQGEKMAVLGEMAASVTHELRNPLVSIGGFAKRLSKITLPETREHEYASIIAREVMRMEEMLSNILAFSKKHMLCLTDCSLSDIVEESLYLEADILDRDSVRVLREIQPDLPAIRGDEQKLRQVVINLIANARQAMAGGGTLTVRAYRTALRGDEAVGLEVEDTGGGIPPEVMRNIFNPFFTTKGKGTGLGLSISHRIIEHHHGEIEVENREKGAAFIIRLPVRVTRQLPVDKPAHFG
jgi:two-component system sensor histidine kinase HydH